MADRANASAAARQTVYSKYLVLTDRDADVIELTLDAAAPHLAAAERERCAQLADQVDAFYASKPHGMPYAPFADLLRKDQP